MKTPETYLREKGFKLKGAGDCLVWTGYINNKGYGRMRREGKDWYSHRLAFSLWFAPIPEGKYVLHTCDNPPCCNPGHLFLGTQKDNMTDAKIKGRTNWGGAKLTAKQVQEIRERYKWGNRQKLADEYGVSPWSITRVVKRHTWR